jgi:hypothetical protein
MDSGIGGGIIVGGGSAVVGDVVGAGRAGREGAMNGAGLGGGWLVIISQGMPELVGADGRRRGSTGSAGRVFDT